MKKSRPITSFFMILSLLFFICSNVMGNHRESSPLWKRLPTVSSFTIQVDVAKKEDIFTYGYTFSNPATSTGKIRSIIIEIQKPKNTIELSDENLVDGGNCLKNKEIITTTIDDIPSSMFKDFPFIPVGITAPPNWACGRGIYNLIPWEEEHDNKEVEDTALVTWWFPEEQNIEGYILPGQSLGGFQLTSRGLPGIRRLRAKPFVDRRSRAWMDIMESDAYDLGPEVKGALGLTLAPTAPPANFAPLAFIKTIHGYLSEAQKLRWLKDTTLAAKLKSHLNDAEKSISGNKFVKANQAIKAFIAALPAPPVGETKACTSECSGLLVFNAQYLLDHLSLNPTLKGKQ